MYGYEDAISRLAEWYFEMNTSELYELERYRRYYYKYNGGLETLMLVSKKTYSEIHNDVVNAAAARYNKQATLRKEQRNGTNYQAQNSHD